MTDASQTKPPAPTPLWARPLFGKRQLLVLFVLANLLLCALPLVPELFGHGKQKDYPLWYGVGQVVLKGGPLYVDLGHGFPYLYPPFAAILLTPFSLFGRAFSIFCICLVNVASWWAAVKLSDRLSMVAGAKPWWVIALPSVLALPFIWDMYDLGQPNLMLLAIMLAGLALMAGGREWLAGSMFAAAVAIKAFPIAILPYLIWRGRWRTAISLVVFTGVFLVLVPAPIRGFERNLSDLRTWAGGMVLSSGEKGFGQRPEQNWGWKNDSLIALTHRFTRPINVEAEHPEYKPFYVNVLNLTYEQSNMVLAGLAGAMGFAFVAVLPPRRRRTPASDAAEYALLIALMTIASPLARAYYFVWLLFPFTLLAYRGAVDPDPKARQVAAWSLAGSIALFCAGVTFGPPHIGPALGNMFWATCVLMGALIWLMRRSMAAKAVQTPALEPPASSA